MTVETAVGVPPSVVTNTAAWWTRGGDVQGMCYNDL